MRKLLWAVILIIGVVLISGCIQPEDQPEELEPAPSLYETREAIPEYYTLYRENDSLENFTKYFMTSPDEEKQRQMYSDRRLKEHQAYLEYLNQTPEGSFSDYLPLRYSIDYDRYLETRPQVTFAEYLLRHNLGYGDQILGAQEEHWLRLIPVSEDEYSLYPNAHAFHEEELLEIPVLYEIFLCNLTDEGSSVRIFEPELEALQPYNRYGGQPFIWNESYYSARFTVT
ncbi:hypothetical protein McpSp1_04770 [Methanocorpusculaceae archaeon Sp1]|nr:hypothetical protein [Methanocorpusculaceae archaeon Sp1]